MKSILFVIPWSGFYIGTNYSFAEAPERAPEGIVGLATYLQAKGASVKIADMQRMLRGNEGNTEKTLNDLWSICDGFRPDIIGFSFLLHDSSMPATSSQLYAKLMTVISGKSLFL